MSKTIVRLKILSPTRLPEEINSLLGVQCDKSWRTGDFRANTKIQEKTYGWILNSGMGESESLEAQVEALLKRLRPCAKEIEALSREHETTVEFSCVVYSAETPALHFDRSVVQEVSRLGAALDIDLYIL